MLIDNPGPVDLHALGAQGPVIVTPGESRSAPLEYEIPRTSGRRQYFRIRFDFLIEMEARPVGSFGYVNALTDEAPSASAEFKIRGDRRGPLVAWNTVNVRGQRSHRTRERVIRVSTWNYVLNAASRPGRHTLRFQLERYRGLDVKRVTILPSTRLQRTYEPPFTLRMRVHPPRRYAKRSKVGVDLINIGSGRARKVSVEANPDDCAAVIKPAVRKVADIRGKRVRMTSFSFRRRSRRACAVQIAARSSVGSATADFSLPAYASSPPVASREGGPASLWAGLLLLPIAAGALALRRRRASL